MHAVLGATDMVGFSGTSVKIDFVEVPSQMFEEWLRDHAVLKRMSAHYKTGDPLSDDVIDKIIENDTFDIGFFGARQIGLSLAALKFYDGARTDVKELFKQIMITTRPHVMYDDENNMIASWGHLTGYGASYYSYLWSKVYALDVFSAIEAQGLLNPEVGGTLIDKVLGRGGSVDPMLLLTDFLGREPNQDAFLKRMGLK
jgi:thimet oligopeptidase